MIVVGIHNTGVNSAAAIFRDGVLIFASQEERFSRIKHDRNFPHKCLAAGLSQFGLTLEDVDCFSISWNPAINISFRTRASFSDWPNHAGYRFSSNPNQILPKLDLVDSDTTTQNFCFDDLPTKKITYISHHKCHAAFSFFSSPFETAAVLSCDGYGERAATAWFDAAEDNLRLVGQVNFPHSLGMFYSAITDFLGFRPHYDEWKVMGASAYGNSDIYYHHLQKLFQKSNKLDYALDLNYFDFYNFDAKRTYSHEMISLLGAARSADEQLNDRHFDIAAAAQRVLEECLVGAAAELKKVTNHSNLCISGGTMMNCVANAALSRSGLFDNVHVPYAPDDPGNCIGAGILENIRIGINPDRRSLRSPLIGLDYPDKDILSIIKRSKLKFKKSQNPARAAAKMLASGSIIGWFQSRSEFGQRALGNRSILADPRDPHIKQKINMAVKFRENFRPFAPAILEEHLSEWFDDHRSAHYMQLALKFKKEKSRKIPGVVHQDGTGRLQTVTKNTNRLFFELISEFYSITDIPIILNTSFNLNNEPIVENAEDAIRTFYSCGLDALFLGNFVIQK